MGYVLPVSQFQSQQYANRMNMQSYNFATIGKVHPVKLKSSFFDEFEESIYAKDEKRRENGDESPGVSSHHSYRGYITPNPANLSPVIAQVVGKGMSVNTYV